MIGFQQNGIKKIESGALNWNDIMYIEVMHRDLHPKTDYRKNKPVICC